MSLRLRAAFVLLLYPSVVWASPRHSSASAPDLFDAFHKLDRQFTSLNTEFHDLQQSMNKHDPQVKRPWRKAASEMRASTASIEAVTYRLSSHYRRTGRKFGYRGFRRLRQDAVRLRAATIRISATKSAVQARREMRRARRAMLDLVLQYQALSGGYAAARCDAGRWFCGAPKVEPRKIGYPAVGVKWTCVPRANSCKGVLGPRAPQLVPEPLTAGTVPH
jgi:hypothetical protein